MAGNKTPSAKSRQNLGNATKGAKPARTAGEESRKQTERESARKKQRKRSRSLAEQRGLVSREDVTFAMPDCQGGRTADWPGRAAVDAMASVNKSVIAAVVDFNGMLCSRIAAINQEWASFIGKRLTEDFELSRRFTACRNPGEVLNAYGSFLQTAFEQYQAEFIHMLKLGQTFASQNGILLKQQIRIAALREDASCKPSSDVLGDGLPEGRKSRT